MSKIDTVISDSVSTVIDQGVQPSRTLWGRLYNGETNIDFMGRKWWGLGISAFVLLISVISLIGQGLNLGLEFKGGAQWEVPTSDVSIDEARILLEEVGVDAGEAKIVTLSSESGTILRIQAAAQDEATTAAVNVAFADAASIDVNSISNTTVSESWGNEITKKAIRALVVFLILVALFIAWRFEWAMALSAILAMIHDMLISVGVYSIFQFEVTPATVIAFLTILGFSLYDTIVVFDRVKENAVRYSGARIPYDDIVNVSMNQVLMRSINTTLAAVLPVLSLLVVGSGIMGASSLRQFSLALLIGLVTGSYSSIFIAAPILAWLKGRTPKYAPLVGGRATGVELSRLVLGGSPAAARREGRQGRSGEGKAGDHSSVAEPVVPTRLASASEVLTHAPRPRKKTRR